MKKEKLIIRYAKPADFDTLAKFRIEQFLSSNEFVVKTPEKLANVAGKVLIAENESGIISTMQFEIMPSHEFFRDYSNANFLSEPRTDIYPSYYLSKAGTSKEYRNTGINSILRIIIIQQAIAESSILSLTGCGYENGPRLNLLKRLGYDFSEIKLSETAYTVPNGKFFFLCLERQKLQSALEKLEEETKELKANFDLEFQLQ